MTWRLLSGDVLDRLRELPDESAHCVVTSPPYWGLRDYGLQPTVWGGEPACEHAWGAMERGKRQDMKPADETRSASRLGVDERQAKAATSGGQFCRRCGAWLGCLGLEPDPELYVEHLVGVLREVRRVLRSDGTAWLNLGDSYAAKARGSDRGWAKSRLTNPGMVQKAQAASLRPTGERHRGRGAGLKEKDLVGIPWRVAFALQADGWWLRADVVWSKPNPMPESVGDRPTRSHEYVFLLARSARYFYDADAIREPAEDVGRENGRDGRDEDERARPPGSSPRTLARLDYTARGRNKRSVWTIATQAYPEAHFATFPEALVEPCILAGTSPKVCGTCSAPWRRRTNKSYANPGNRATNGPRSVARRHLERGSAGYPQRLEAFVQTIGWAPSCEHDDASGRCLVLDPFAGSGTTLMVAERLGRDSIGIERNPEYVDLARRRIIDDCPLHNQAAEAAA